MTFWRRASEQVHRGINHNEATKEGELTKRTRKRAAVAALRRAVVEPLELRTLLATLPLPVMTDHIDVDIESRDSLSAGWVAGSDSNSPSIAYDPMNTQRLVTTYTRNGEVVGSYSLNGGKDWDEFVIPPRLAGYAQASDSSVAFDRAGNFYLVYSEHAADNSTGAIVLQKYNMPANMHAVAPNDGVPVLTATKDKIIWSWSGNDAAVSPTVAVDNNLPSFTDGGQTVTDAYAGYIYVAWASAPVGANSSRIRMQASSNGTTFSDPVTVSTGNADASPRIVISQGTANGRVTPGQVTVIWDDFSNAQQDTIRSTRITGGSIGVSKPPVTATKAIPDATAPVPIPPDPPTGPDTMGQTTSTITLPTDAAFTITDLDIDLSVTHGDLSQLWIQLTLPGGNNIVLVSNGVDSENPPNQIPGGLTGANLTNTILDDDAFTPIAQLTGQAAPYTGRFNLGGALAAFYNRTLAAAGAGGLGGSAFTLTIRDYHTPTNGTLNWTIRMNSFTTPSSVVATTRVHGAGTAPYTLTAPAAPLGISPGAVIASDNTLGLFSPYQGRLYVAYADRLNPATNAADNTDIFLAYSDDGGIGWTVRKTDPTNPLSTPLRVNDDNAVADGFSEGGASSGRPQFQPAIAVDQTTGTLVMSYLDARHDGVRTRVATYVATSIDGGATFGPQTFANVPNVAEDAITGNPVVLGPLPDNPSANVDAAVVFGERQGLAVVSGRIYPVWAGNQNGWDVAQKQVMDGTHILTALMTIPAGPRIVSSTMGPVGQSGDTVNPAMVDGTPQFSAIRVQFDRMIDPASFTTNDIKVWYRDTSTGSNLAGVPVAIGSVTPLDAGIFGPAAAAGATLFLVKMDAPQLATGTYSYEIAPNYTSPIRRVETVFVPDAPTTYTATAAGLQVNLPIPSVGTGGSAVAAENLTTSTVTVAGVPVGKVVGGVTVNLTLTHAMDKDLVLTLIGPDGTRVVLANNRGGNTGADYTNTTFDDNSIDPISTVDAPFTGTFAPDERLGAFLGETANGVWTLEINDTAGTNVGTLVGWSLTLRTAYPAVAPYVNLAIPAVGTGGSGSANLDTITSTLTVAGPVATRIITHVAVNVRITHTRVSDLVLRLIAPDTTEVWLSTNHGGDTGANYTNTTFDSNAGVSISDAKATAPFTGWFRPEQSLDCLVGRDALGDWKLEIQDTGVGNTGTLVAWSLDIQTAAVTNSPMNVAVADQDADGTGGETANIKTAGDVYAIPRPVSKTSYNGSFFTAPFDQDTLPVVVPGPHIISPIYAAPANQVGLAIPAVGDGGTGDIAQDVTTSTFTVNANANATINDLNVYLSLNHTMVSDLKITLIGPDGAQAVLADHVGGAGQNFLNTVFDDAGDQAIAVGVAPFTGVFRPKTPLNVMFAGKKLAGEWTLQIQDSVAANSGTLVSWSLQAQTANDNLTLNNSVGFIDVTFDRDMDPATFTADSILRMVGPAGLVNGPRLYVATENLYVSPASNSGKILDGPSGAALIAPLTIDEDYRIGDLKVRLNIAHTRVGDLTVLLISPTGLIVPLIVKAGGANANFTDTLLSDDANISLATGIAPFNDPNGYRPATPLSAMDEASIRGTWKLQVSDDTAGQAGWLRGWSLIATPSQSSYTVTGDPNGTDPDPAHPRTFRVGFPTQKSSGTYTMTLAPGITSAAGDALDTNLNAGVDLLRGTSSATTSATFTNNAQKTLSNLVIAESTITISEADSFVISNDGFTLQMDVDYPNDPDLMATLYPPQELMDQGAEPITIFSNVGNTGLRANFADTIFSDAMGVTPVQNGAAPFLGSFKPQMALANAQLIGQKSAGIWRLQITSSDVVFSRSGTLNYWSLTFRKPVPSSGLGEAVADQYTTGFRIFTMDPANPLSHSEWTSIGGATTGNNASAGRVGALAVDPSDPTGNTVYVGGASGGLWKTTNFLTTDPQGPMYLPLTDFGPTSTPRPGTSPIPGSGMKISSIAVFGRNSDPTKSIIFASTGDPNKKESQIGFLRSMDGGATWTVVDSEKMTDQYGNPLAWSARDHNFADSIAYKVVVDPRPTPSGKVIVYAALAGSNYGLWRSLDSGDTWQNMNPRACTDVVLDPNSGYFDTLSNPTGNLQTIYGAFPGTGNGTGVLMSPNRGQVWNAMSGTIGNPLIQDADTPGHPAIPVTAVTPNWTNSRIVLAKPAATGVPVQDLLYQGWLYAVVVTAAPDDPVARSVHDGGQFVGLYLTKDFGQNWTRVQLKNYQPANPPSGYHDAVPTNDAAAADYDIVSDALRIPNGQGLYDITLAIDPNDSDVVYIGGTTNTGGPGFIRVDTTGISDPHAFFVRDIAGTDPLTLVNPGTPGSAINPLDNPYINLIQDPLSPFLMDATVLVSNVDSLPGRGFANTGIGAKWIGFDSGLGGAMNQHALVAVKDPLTGGTRLIMGDDQGVVTFVDQGGGKLATGIGTAQTVSGARNGNLQLAEFFQGAAQPTNNAANAANAMFYGMGMSTGYPQSAWDVLSTGNITWTGTTGSGTSVATDQQGLGTLYQFKWPETPGVSTNFFQVNGIGRTSGLLQSSSDTEYASHDAQWPDLVRPYLLRPVRPDQVNNPQLIGPRFDFRYINSNFALNPIEGDQIVIGSSDGRIYATENAGQFWSLIRTPRSSPGFVRALAYGAPDTDPQNPGQNGATGFFIYAGMAQSANIYVTVTGGGDDGNDWNEVSSGLTGNTVAQIVTNPMRTSHEAYAATDTGVFHMGNSKLDPGDPALKWIDITGNLMYSQQTNTTGLLHDPFGDLQLRQQRVTEITSVQADWRYAIPDNPSDPASPTHPVLYVGTNAGVYRSLDGGKTWTPFPDIALDGAAQAGGYMPNVRITDLDLTLGRIDSTTGQPEVSSGPDVLLATTYGRGSYAIRVAPLIMPGSIVPFRLDPASDRGFSNTDGITSATGLSFQGMSEQTAFGNKVRITLLDMADPLNPILIGGYDPALGEASAIYTDATGKFTVAANLGVFATGGTKIIGVQATDDAGAVGPIVTTSVTVDVSAPDVTPATLTPLEGMAVNGTVATFTDPDEAVIANMTATIDWGDGLPVRPCNIVANGSGGYNVVPQSSHTYVEEGPYTISITVTDAAGNVTTATNPITVADRAVIPTGGYTFTATEGAASTEQTVATFTDPAGAEGLSDYSAVIDWGDGSTSAGVITVNAGSLFAVKGSHTYSEEGTYPISTTISHDAAPTASATSTARVSDLAVIVTGGFTMATPDGDPLTNKVVATFTDPGDPLGVEPLTDYSATIAWGDGTTSAGVITYDALSKVFTVTGTHLYADNGDYIVVTTITHDTAPTASGTSLASVTDTPITAAGGFTIAADEGAAFANQIVATFTDPGIIRGVGSYIATIAWGDGTTSGGAITYDPVAQVFLVRGGHTYPEEAAYTITTTIRHGTTTPAVVTSSATVADVQVLPVGGFTVSTTEGVVAATQTVARFTDPGGAEALTDYSATIDWGDGSNSVGVISYDPTAKVFAVSGSHKYTLQGTYPITTTIRHDTMPAVSAISSATVADVPMVPTGGFTIAASEGIATTVQTAATFTDPSGPRELTNYSATINWGDGSVADATITYDSVSKVFSVVGSHLYADNGTYPVTTTIQHAASAPVTAVSSASVQQAEMTPAITGAAVAFVGKSASFSLMVADVSGADQAAGFAHAINWGDGTPVENIAAAANNGAGVVLTHTYQVAGSFSIQVTTTNRSSETAGTGMSVQVMEPTGLGTVAINGSGIQRSSIDTISFQPIFDGQILSGISTANLKLVGNGGAVVPLTAAKINYDAATATATLDLSKVALPDGNYQLQVKLGTGVVQTISFHKLTGDVDGTGTVDYVDQGIIQASLGKSSGQTGFDPNADVNHDGTVTNADLKVAQGAYRNTIAIKSVTLGLTSKAPRVKAIGFGTFKTRGTAKAIDLIIRNNGTVAMSVQSLLITDATRLFTIMSPKGLWTKLPKRTILKAGQSMTVRIYFTPGTPKTVWASLGFSYSIGKKSIKVAVPTWAVVRR
ncbi:MAG: proprotein convertase P-domain-containing protein [Planctomycetota bacterium]|nr:proprotein convertase P-domain-containing protein [Planctomycetota bacterium]